MGVAVVARVGRDGDLCRKGWGGGPPLSHEILKSAGRGVGWAGSNLTGLRYLSQSSDLYEQSEVYSFFRTGSEPTTTAMTFREVDS